MEDSIFYLCKVFDWIEREWYYVVFICRENYVLKCFRFVMRGGLRLMVKLYVFLIVKFIMFWRMEDFLLVICVYFWVEVMYFLCKSEKSRENIGLFINISLRNWRYIGSGFKVECYDIC